MDAFEWWISESPFNGMSGAPSGPPRWPRSGGVMRQPNRIVQAVSFFRHAYVTLQNRHAERHTEKASKRKR